MIGIYKIVKKENGKTYVGQSNNIERRFSEHRYKKEIPIDLAIQKYGADAFDFEVIEECLLEELNEREVYWIATLNTFKGFGYNAHEGGNSSQGEKNSNAKVSEDDVCMIRQAYNKRLRRRDVYKLVEDKISFHTFAAIWDGSSWPHIMPEVYTEENKQYYMREATIGALSPKATLTSEEVLLVRQRYVNETAKEIYEDYKDRMGYQTLQQILWGRTYKDVPIYKKKEKKWINL